MRCNLIASHNLVGAPSPGSGLQRTGLQRIRIKPAKGRRHKSDRGPERTESNIVGGEYHGTRHSLGNARYM